VLGAIGADEVGVVNFSAIAATLGGGKAAETAVSRAMKVLVDLKQIVAVDFPGGRQDSRLKRYRVADPYLDAWWERSGSDEFDLVGAGHDRLPLVAGSVKWRENQPFNDRDLAKLAAARSVIPHAERASLLAVAPHGAGPEVGVEMVLDADDLLGAWHS
jgi:hypothetical protein